ncbi:MAG: small multi-drug export protein [Firmicutes bacterium]|nr:small multi-drug export protein [Bacillota bacterium]
MEFIENFFATIFGNSPTLATFFIAATPVLEIKAAIPFGTSDKLWGARSLDLLPALGISIISSVMVTAIMLALLVPVFNLLKKIKPLRRTINWLETKFTIRAQKLCKDHQELCPEPRHTSKPCWPLLIPLFIFAALPVPLTGVYTASAIAVFLRLPYLHSLTTITLGTITSGSIIAGITYLFGANSLYVFHGFLLLTLVSLTAYILFSFFKRKQFPTQSKKV